MESVMSEKRYCSEACSESMAGTSDVVDVWLLLEYRPAWKSKALAASDLAQPTKLWVQKTVDSLAERGLKVRPQLIRRPELDTEQVRLLIAWDQAVWEFSGNGYDFLQDLDLASWLAAGPGQSPLAAARKLSRPRYFVCTNGQRDLCCARFGLPVYNALRESVGDRVWQVSHLGGHRFAPNILVLPDAVMYGRVNPETLHEFVSVVESGKVAFAHLRGRSRYPKHVQAAEAFLGKDELRLLHVDGDAEAAAVTFAMPGGQAKVQVELAETRRVLASCGDDALSEVAGYRAGRQ
jgi:hypothetical protein